MDSDKRSAWLQKLDAELPYQVVLERRKLWEEGELFEFLANSAGKFDMYVEDEYAVFVRYCFEDEFDAAIFESRFGPKIERLKLVG